MAVVNTISKKMPMLILFWSQTPVEEKGEKKSDTRKVSRKPARFHISIS